MPTDNISQIRPLDESASDGTSPSALDPRFLVSESELEPSAVASKAPDFSLIVDNAAPSAEQVGRITKAYGTTLHVSGLTAYIGQRCSITTPGKSVDILADVVGITSSHIILYPLGSLDGLSNGSEVRVLKTERSIPFSEDLTGCILDGSGKIIYQPHSQTNTMDVSITRSAPDPLTRRSIDSVFSTGIKAIDTLLTVGEGQRVGIFAPAGGGKSTLLSMLAHHSNVDVVVIGLIGERGREVREFIENNLGVEGLARSVLVVSTSDRPAIERVNAAHCATTIAEGFRARGKKVLLLMDSLTRYARALREIGLSVGEPPVRRGFPPSVFSELPKLLERSGNDQTSSITAFYTVLAEDEESTDPITEEVRSILDGHIVLSRAIGEQGIYPPIDILSSASRLINEIATQQHVNAAVRIRQLMAKYQELELLIQVGEYQAGSDAEADEAVEKKDAIKNLLQQHSSLSVSFEEATAMLHGIAG